MDERSKNIKKARQKIGICMGLTMSLFLSLLGNITSGHFMPIIFIVTFVVSSILSLIISILVPMDVITAKVTSKMKPGGIGTLIASALVSDIIYTPVITFSMISLVRFMLPSEVLERMPPFPVMYTGSLIPSFIAGFFLVMIFLPIFQKILIGRKPE